MKDTSSANKRPTPAKRGRQGLRTPVEQRLRIIELGRERYTVPQIADQLASEFGEGGARERTIRRILREQLDASGEWRLLDATADEAAMVPAVLAAESRRTGWRVRSVTRGQAAMIVLVRRAVPRLSPDRVLAIADYLAIVRSLDLGGLEADMERDLEVTLGAMAGADDPDALAERLRSGGIDAALSAVRSLGA